MAEWEGLGKLLLGIGLFIAVTGLVLMAADRMPGITGLFNWIGKLPGDISFKRDNFSFYFPLGTSVLLSVLLSLLFYFLSWLFRR
ncbi:MAG TPA: DUF2905 domain-containing protein [Nitrospira sp.]|nr:DUF2905 domain-containing protein [Nitrospira sp.]